MYSHLSVLAASPVQDTLYSTTFPSLACQQTVAFNAPRFAVLAVRC